MYIIYTIYIYIYIYIYIPSRFKIKKCENLPTELSAKILIIGPAGIGKNIEILCFVYALGTKRRSNEFPWLYKRPAGVVHVLLRQKNGFA